MHKPGPQIVGKYEILARLREGGMGSIYKVRHRLLDEIRVIKVMRPHAAADEDLKNRFVQEAKMATRLKHPNIATIYDFALDDDGTAYLVLEYIEGVTLADLLESQGSPSLPLSMEIAHQALLALGYLHRKNVVHRDISPDNLMLTHDERDKPLLKLIDLGIAKALDKPGAMTSTGIFLGKVKYASPEQFGTLSRGEKLDGRSDLYSLGVVLYEVLTGTHPYEGETPTEFMRAHVSQPPLPFSETDPGGRVPPELQAIVSRALEKKREDRFASAEKFDDEIVALQARISGPESLKGTQVLLSRFQTVAASRSRVSTSDQDRLNRHFAAQPTPHPTPSENLTGIRTVVSGSNPLGVERHSRRKALWIVTVAALVFLTAAFIWKRVAEETLLEPPRRQVARSFPYRATSVPVTSPVLEPTAKIERAAPVPSPVLAGQPTLTERSPEKKTATGSEAPIRNAPSVVEAHLRSRERTNQSPAIESPTPINRIVQPVETSPTAQRASLPEQTPPAVVPAHDVASPLEPTAPPTVSETERIRELLLDYQRAMTTLDVSLYVRVFPSCVGERRRRLESSWRNLKSQRVELDILRIEVMDARARVRARQTTVATPLVGTEQHDARECILSLEKRGNAWVISTLD